MLTNLHMFYILVGQYVIIYILVLTFLNELYEDFLYSEI